MSSTLAPQLVALAALCAIVLPSRQLEAAGFEIGENTTESLARGGTGAVLKRDPSAVYFNPALLARARGFQVLLDGNLVNVNVDFQRAQLVVPFPDGPPDVNTFNPVNNQRGFFPAPFLAVSWDLGLEDFALALGVFGPPAYGSRCYGVLRDGDCQLAQPTSDDGRINNSSRYMMVSSDLLQLYFTLGAGWRFDLGPGELSLGISGILAWQNNSFQVVVDGSLFPVAPWRERTDDDATFRGNNLSGFAPSAIFGLGYRVGGFHLGASYRPPIFWSTEGTAELDFSQTIREGFMPTLTNDAVTLETWQAGTLRAGVGYEGGTHPRFEGLPRYGIEANVVWEDWGRVDTFDVALQGDVANAVTPEPLDVPAIQQLKDWQDTLSLRIGANYAPTPWLTASIGGMLETPAQRSAVTNVDFLSWERRVLGFGTTFHVTDWLDIKAAYAHIFMPDREVSGGRVFNSVPLSACVGPAFNDDSCDSPGRPPGNPQNNGTWSASAQIVSLGLGLRFN